MEKNGDRIMRDLIRQIVERYKSLKLEGQQEGYVLFSGQEPDTRLPVQIKVLPQLLDEDPQIAARFRRLAQAIRQLNHPNIPATRDVGEQSGLPYIITRAIEKAEPLADKLNQPWAVDAAADLTMEIGQAMEHAYNKGVVHGSLSPQNILVQDNGKVTVNDFGLAELLDLVGAQVRQTASPFLAPERIAGKPADARADVYSLGAVLYRLLAARPPQVVQGQVLPPSRFDPEVSPEMDQVVVKALDPNPANRYPDVRSFLAALGAVTLVPAREEVESEAPGNRCPRCGAENQTGRFCRRCGARLDQRSASASAPPPTPPTAESKLEEPIQITSIDVGRLEVGSGVEVQETAIAQPLAVASETLSADFPDPLPMPEIGQQAMWPSVENRETLAMPEPPPMPVVDWAEIAPPMPQVPSVEDIPIETEDR
jgi:serine/threonine protein kinase